MEWTPESLQAEIDYRQTALREDAAQYRVGRRTTSTRRSWWRLGHRGDPESAGTGNGHDQAA
ncbi:hypothetical protein [Saccharothrix sp. HUAS TT1]|uniref:hypothetical protein n=1 Tax=unclassified Saccharothrix TaxID=2593673 RepID=UPI00345BAD42